ncbi:hypothetical protein RM437_06540 [Citrobacter werkmanii]|uniref:phage baseplate protein n=1 Tax=Citrobacter werkmanii TaxID=67827 RepID=UPI002886D342|nr:hypothetical protein [Citrobacter werkmanii]MDT0637690.1 hypothetical protein [Citrobacter werkmanii]
MPIETAQYIDTLQPDWPDGKDPESGGDDHIRMVKQVLKNTFPAANNPVTGTPEQLNNLTNGMWYGEAEDLPNGYWYHQNPSDNTQEAFLAGATPSVAQCKAHPDLMLSWEAIQYLIYPVGSVVMNSTGVNPADYMGFGTWTQRSGAIYGTGENIADQFGALKTIAPGQHTADASWRIQDSQIVAQNLNLEINPVEDHQHAMQRYGDFEDGKNAEGGGSYAEAPAYSTHMTDPAGGHTPTGLVTIGVGAATEGNQFMNPGWAFTVWERTA